MPTAPHQISRTSRHTLRAPSAARILDVTVKMRVYDTDSPVGADIIWEAELRLDWRRIEFTASLDEDGEFHFWMCLRANKSGGEPDVLGDGQEFSLAELGAIAQAFGEFVQRIEADQALGQRRLAEWRERYDRLTRTSVEPLEVAIAR